MPKYSDPPKNCCNYPKIWTVWLYHRVMSPKDADGMANRVDPDQTALLVAVRSGSTLFAQAYLSKNLESLWCKRKMSQLMRLWYLSHRRPVKTQASLRIRAVSPEPLLSVQAHLSLRCSHTWSMEVDEGSDQKSDWMAAQARLKNELTEDEMCHNLVSWLKYGFVCLQEGRLCRTINQKWRKYQPRR